MKLPKLDTQDFNTMFQQAKAMYEHTSKETIQDSDPIFTFLESQVMLVDMLNYYIESVSEKEKAQHQNLRMLDTRTTRQTVWLYLDEGHRSLQNERQLDKYAVFSFPYNSINYYVETMHSYPRFSFDVSSVFIVSNKVEEKVCMIMNQTDVCYHSLPLQEHDAIYIATKQHLPMKERLYLSVLCDESLRHAVGNQALFKDEWRWEFYSMHGWQNLAVEDTTCGFRYSGEISFLIQKHMDKKMFFHEEGFWLRAVKQQSLERSSLHIYDMRYHYLLCVPQFTYAMHEEFEKKERIPYNTAFPILNVYAKDDKEEGWSPCAYQIESIDHKDYVLPEKEYATYRCVYQRPQLKDAVETIAIQGVSSQFIQLSDTSNVEIALRHHDTWWDIPLYQEPVIDSQSDGAIIEAEGLRFGNGRDFLIPEADPQGLLILHMVKQQKLSEELFSSLTSQQGCSLIKLTTNDQCSYHTPVFTRAELQSYMETIEGCMFTQVKVTEDTDGFHIVVKGECDQAFDFVFLTSLQELIRKQVCYGCSFTIEEAK